MNASFKLNELTIETNRLLLRPFNQSDLNDFFEYSSVEVVGEMAGWKHHENIEKSKEILNLFIEEDKTFAICLKESGKVIVFGTPCQIAGFRETIKRIPIKKDLCL